MSRYLLYELAGALIHPTKALGDRVHEDNLLAVAVRMAAGTRQRADVVAGEEVGFWRR